MTANTKKKLPTVYIGDKFTLDGTEVTVSNTLGIENMGGDLVGVVVKVLSDDVHIDPSAMRSSTRIVAGDDMYPTGRVDDAIGYLKDTRAHVHTGHVATYGAHADRMPNEVLDVIDEVLDRLGVPVVETEETEEVRAWGTNNVVRTTTAHTGETINRADAVVLHLDGMSFVTDGKEVEVVWVGADCIDNLCLDSTTHITRVWPIDDPHHLGNPLETTTPYTTTTVRWDAVYNDGAYVVPDRVVTVNTVRLGEDVTDDRMSRAEYEVSVNHETKYTDLVSLQTRDEYTANMAKEEDNG